MLRKPSIRRGRGRHTGQRDGQAAKNLALRGENASPCRPGSDFRRSMSHPDRRARRALQVTPVPAEGPWSAEMAALIGTVGLAFVAFASTNIDDIFVVSAFFAEPGMRPRSVAIGQFVGIGALVLASLVVARLALTMPEGWVSLLGLVPLVLGVRRLVALRRSNDGDDVGAGERRLQEEELVVESRIHSQVLAVAGVTIANGGDNIAVYVPLFAASIGAIGVYSIVFACMTAVWCAVGYIAVNNRVVGGSIRRYGHVVLPLVLVVLGLYILSGAAVLMR